MARDDKEVPPSSLAATRVATRSDQAMRAVKPAAGRPGARLVVIVGPKIGVQHALGEEGVDIGRDPSCGFPVDNDLVSRRHARIEWTGSGYRIADLGSTNGTFVNDQRITQRDLVDGDRISIGKAMLKFLGSNNVEAEYHQVIFHLMSHDGLTGIHNKRHFDEGLSAATARPGLLSLLVMDVDFFKKINDTYGHAAGDAVLRRLAETVSTVVPPGCTFARVGGEEFSVLCPETALEGAVTLGETIRRKVEQTTFDFEGTLIPVTTSIGVACRGATSALHGTELYKAADAQLYEAKQSGRNRVRATATG